MSWIIPTPKKLDNLNPKIKNPQSWGFCLVVGFFLTFDEVEDVFSFEAGLVNQRYNLLFLGMDENPVNFLALRADDETIDKRGLSLFIAADKNVGVLVPVKLDKCEFGQLAVLPALGASDERPADGHHFLISEILPSLFQLV